MPSNDLLDAVGIDLTAPEQREEFNAIVQRLVIDPEAVAVELMRARRACSDSAQAAEQLEAMIRELVEKNASLVHVETVRTTPGGRPRAVCRLGNSLQELGVHPSVNLEELESLQPWEYACVHEGVVIGLWRDDPALLASHFGDLVTFDGFVDHDNFIVRIKRPGHDEGVATLAGPLRIEPLQPGMKLILQRDDARWAIACLPAEHSESKFEVPLDQVRTRLDQLAGLDEVAETFIQDILLRIVFEEVRDEFDLSPMRGALLYSYQPGMGKTMLMEAIAVWLRDFGEDYGFDVALYHIKPNALKSMWWGEDARIVREDLWGSIRARQRLPRTRPLVQLVVFDEIDSLQKRSGGERMASSSSHSDALEALLVEMQGMAQNAGQNGPPAHVLCVGLTNRPDRLDEALKRPGRFGDFVSPMPAVTRDSATDIMAIYASRQSLPWSIDGEVRRALSKQEVCERFLGPAVARIFPAVVAKYATDTQKTYDVTAGQILAGVHYQDAVNRAKRRAALRRVLKVGAPAVCPEDVVDCLLDAAMDVAKQMEADPGMLVHQLQIKLPVVRVTAVPRQELEQHRFLKLHTA
jgi:ATP-dependent 26S proteasome regulatory subunit